MRKSKEISKDFQTNITVLVLWGGKKASENSHLCKHIQAPESEWTDIFNTLKQKYNAFF